MGLHPARRELQWPRDTERERERAGRVFAEAWGRGEQSEREEILAESELSGLRLCHEGIDTLSAVLAMPWIGSACRCPQTATADASMPAPQAIARLALFVPTRLYHRHASRRDHHALGLGWTEVEALDGQQRAQVAARRIDRCAHGISCEFGGPQESKLVCAESRLPPSFARPSLSSFRPASSQTQEGAQANGGKGDQTTSGEQRAAVSARAWGEGGEGRGPEATYRGTGV